MPISEVSISEVAVREVGEMPVAVVIIEPHSVVRHALRSALEATGRFGVVGEANSPDQAESLIKITRPALVITTTSGTSDSLRQICTGESAPSLVMLTCAGPASPSTAGTHAVTSQTGWLAFIDILNTAAKRATLSVASQRQNSGTVAWTTERGSQLSQTRMDALSLLSKREREVFYLLADGIPNRIIAKQLFVSPRTIETHRARVIKKLGLTSTAGLIKYAIRHQLLAL